MLNYLAIGYKNNYQVSQLSPIITMQVRPWLHKDSIMWHDTNLQVYGSME